MMQPFLMKVKETYYITMHMVNNQCECVPPAWAPLLFARQNVFFFIIITIFGMNPIGIIRTFLQIS